MLNKSPLRAVTGRSRVARVAAAIAGLAGFAPLAVVAQSLPAGSPERLSDSGFEAAASAAALAYRMDAAGRAYAPRTPGDSDLGEQLLLLPRPAYEPFSVITNLRGQYTSNAGLSDNDELDDFIYRAEVGAAYVPHLAGNLYGRLTASYEFFRYDDHSRFDFDNLEAAAGLVHVFRALNDLTVWGRYEFTRITGGGGSDELFANHGMEAGVFLPIALTSRQNLFLSQISRFSLDADPGYARFHQFSFIVGHELAATDALSLRTFYQISVLDYDDAADRNDLLQTVGLALRYALCRNAAITVSGTYQINDSDVDGGDYEVGTAGASLGLTVTF